MSFSRYIHADSILFKYARGASQRVGREFHPYHEIILFLGEEADLFSEQGHTRIAPDTLIVIPKETYHQLRIVGAPEAYHRCVVNFPDLPNLQGLIEKSMTGLFVIKVSEEVAFLFRKLIDAIGTHASDGTDELLLRSVLPLLLSEIGREGAYCHTSMPPVVAQCIAYVSEHITEPISVERVAQMLNVSASLLSHIFKKEMNISLYQYVLKKRLTMALQRISMGEPAAVVAAECGFHDYSNFYRQYKKAFGNAPSLAGK